MLIKRDVKRRPERPEMDGLDALDGEMHGPISLTLKIFIPKSALRFGFSQVPITSVSFFECYYPSSTLLLLRINEIV